MDVGNLISGSFVFSKSSLNIWKVSVQVLLKPGSKNFEQYFARVWDECNGVVVWTVFGAGVQPRWIQGIRSGDRVGEDQETTA